MFSYVIQYKQGQENVVADALSHKYTLLSPLNAKLPSFEHIKQLYPLDHDLSEKCSVCEKTTNGRTLGIRIHRVRTM